jgi:hypothetical protein
MSCLRETCISKSFEIVDIDIFIAAALPYNRYLLADFVEIVSDHT